MSDLRDYFIARERTQTRYQQGPGDGERKCLSCRRKRYGGPSCCNEGWERYRADDPGGCTNWTGWDPMAGPDPSAGEGGG